MTTGARLPTPEDLAYVARFIKENRDVCSARELRFVAMVTWGQMTPTAAARKLGYKSPATMGAHLVKRPHVAHLLLAHLELCREILRLTADEESAVDGQ